MTDNRHDVPQSLLDELENQRFIVDGVQMAELKRLFIEQREPLRWLYANLDGDAGMAAQDAWRLAYRIEQIVARFRVFQGDEAHALDMGNDEN
jgi:hypothetical protein